MKQIDGIEVAGYDGPNYKTLLASGSWRVAFLNHGDKFSPERPERLERHLETDEVFVLLDGSATLFVGKEMNSVKMERFRIYNVKRGFGTRYTRSRGPGASSSRTWTRLRPTLNTARWCDGQIETA